MKKKHPSFPIVDKSTITMSYRYIVKSQYIISANTLGYPQSPVRNKSILAKHIITLAINNKVDFTFSAVDDHTIDRISNTK